MNPMEQPPKGVPVEQLPLDLGIPTEDEVTATEESLLASGKRNPEVKEVAFETLETGELEVLFYEKVGFDPKMRFLDRSEDNRRTLLIEGIKDPQKGLDSVSEFDAQSDREQRELGRGHY